MKNTRTLNSSFKGKKSSKKSSKKNRNTDNTTTEEMRQLLDSDTEVVFNNHNSNKLIPFQGDQIPTPMNPQMMGAQMMGSQMMGSQMMGSQMMNNNHLQMYSPANYDPLMLQQLAPVQNSQAIQNSGMPGNLLSPGGMLGNLTRLGKGSIGAFNGGPQTPFGADPMPNIPAPQPNPMPSSALANLQMLGGARIA